ncbi:hypothetical protein KCU71_g2697, partial [Aureobasidium melanogenum]
MMERTKKSRTEREREEYEKERTSAHWRVQCWIAQMQTRVLRSFAFLGGMLIYHLTVEHWPKLLTAQDHDVNSLRSLAHLVCVWLLISMCDALFLALWWIEISPRARLSLGTCPRLKFVCLRALVLKPLFAVTAALIYEKPIGWLFPKRASLSDLTTLSFYFFNLRSIFAMLWDIRLLSFNAIFQTFMSVVTTTFLILWIDAKYAFVSFIQPSRQTLQYNDLWYEIAPKKD